MRARAAAVGLGFLAISCVLLVLSSTFQRGDGDENASSLLSVGGIYLGTFAELGVGSAAPDFPQDDDVQWLNTKGSNPPQYLRGGPLSLRKLRKEGKIVLLHFWDYTNMRSIMSLSALSRWHERYSPFGVKVISVHRSRFPFASRLLWVARAVERLGIKHAVVNDEHVSLFPLQLHVNICDAHSLSARRLIDCHSFSSPDLAHIASNASRVM
jgi:hypothetical protein